MEKVRRPGVLARAVAVVSAAWLAGLVGGAGEGGGPFVLPTPDGKWSVPPGTSAGRRPVTPGTVEIRGVGVFSFDPAAVGTFRPDLFREGHLSVFDVLVHVAAREGIPLEYVWDETTATHAVVSLNGLAGWWYDTQYAGGEIERTTVRMDQFPVKDGMRIRLYLDRPERLAAIEQSFREEVRRRDGNGGLVVVPEVTIRGPRWMLVVRDLLVEPTGGRADVFQSGVVTALDVLLALGREGVVSSLTLVWHDHLDGADQFYAFMVHGLLAGEDEASPSPGCALVHQTGSAVLDGFLAPHGHGSSHVHLTADLEALVSPEFVRWSWLCP